MIYMLLGTGFEETEAIAPLDLLRRANLSVMTVGLSGKVIVGSHNIPVTADIELSEMDLTELDMIILPGGLRGVASIRGCEGAMDAIRFAYENGKWIAAICAAPTILAELHITDGKNATCYPTCSDKMGTANLIPGAACVRDGMVITGTSAGCAVPFGLGIIAALAGQQEADRIADQIVIR